MNSVNEPIPRIELPWRRTVVFRIGAVAFGFVLLLGLEGLLRIANVGRLEDMGDPYVGFSNVVPLFVLNESGERYAIPTSRQQFFRPDSFDATKASNEYRIFCFGGSTVQGRPYAIETSFTRWLELSLAAADPNRRWRVINCGGVSYASYRLLPILKECVEYEPDMFIVYTGHNEFLEDRSYADIKHEPAWRKSIFACASKWHIYSATRQLLRPAARAIAPVENLPQEVDALLDYEGGMEQYRRDPDWKLAVAEHYEFNLRRLVQIAKTADVPLMLANPVSNIRDTAPFKAEVDPEFPDAQKQLFTRLWEEAKQAPWDNIEAKLELARKVVEFDPGHPEGQFLLARVLESARAEQGEIATAYYLAKDEDVCPLRMTEAMHESVLLVARQTGTPLIDVRKMFEEASENGIPGDDQMIDHVHPRINGHKEIANLVFLMMLEQKILSATPEWEARRDALFRENFDSLPNNYFPESQARLEGLTNWANGRAKKLKLPIAKSESSD